MRELDQLRAEVAGIFAELRELGGDELTPAAHALLTSTSDLLANQTFYVVVCGEYRRGKSSLLNALIGRKQLFPTNLAVTTNTVTTLTWGPAPRAVVRFRPDHTGIARAAEEIPTERVHEYVTEQENPANGAGVERVDIELPAEALRSGLVLVDTPGIGGVDRTHTAVTHAFLPYAEAIVFVLSALDPPTTYELDFLRRAAAANPALVVALTMIDQIIEPGPVIAASRQRIAAVAGVPPEQLALVPVSSRERWEAAATGDDERLAASGLPALEREIWERLTVTCGAARLLRAVDALDQVAKLSTSPLVNELAALADDQARERVERDLAQIVNRGVDLRTKGEGWLTGMSDDLTAACRAVTRRFDDRMAACAAQLRSAVHSRPQHADPEQLLEQARTAVIEATGSALQEVQAAAEQVAVAWAARTSLGLRGVEVRQADDVAPELPAPVPDTRAQPVFTDALRSAVEIGATLSAPGALVGSLIGSFVPVVGTAVGTAVGGAVGQAVGLIGGLVDYFRRTKAQFRAEQATRFTEQLVAALDENTERVHAILALVQQEALAALKTQLTTQLEAQLQTLDESVRRVEGIKRRTGQERSARQRALIGRLAQYRVFGSRMQRLQKELTAVTDRRPRPEPGAPGSAGVCR